MTVAHLAVGADILRIHGQHQLAEVLSQLPSLQGRTAGRLTGVQRALVVVLSHPAGAADRGRAESEYRFIENRQNEKMMRWEY